jgi:hypothetical protein
MVAPSCLTWASDLIRQGHRTIPLEGPRSQPITAGRFRAGLVGGANETKGEGTHRMPKGRATAMNIAPVTALVGSRELPRARPMTARRHLWRYKLGEEFVDDVITGKHSPQNVLPGGRNTSGRFMPVIEK